MILYHGSNVKVAKIDLEKCRPFKDFGRGFYLTEIEGQAVQMAERVARLYGGLPVVSKFALDEAIYGDKSLRTMKFDEANKDWRCSS
jgi:hypothetical protein